ncbi:hypothetical protein [Euzebya tangerina]|uniref:hypothetical protein n=1 Tax=Euzebya tangerina TaxID=591198 RepID=UPI0013C34A56|nr:hypothetical protein [Euzebya tangerina]
MDSAELDRWLDEDLGPQPDQVDTGWEPSPAVTPRSAERGRPEGRPQGRLWLLIGGVAAAIWIVVMVVVSQGDGDQDGPVSTTPSPPPDDAAVDDDLIAPVPTAGSDPAGGLSEVAVEATPTAALDPPQELPTTFRAVGPATAALRARLTAESEGHTSYLEWATPVEVVPLGAGVDLVVLDAIWLAGPTGEGLGQVHQARWAVPVADDGRVLSAPWPHSAAPPQEREVAEPPMGTVRIGEVEQAVRAAGWTDVTVVGSDPHPLLPGAVTALVEGVPPGGGDVTAEVVWLHEDTDGSLQVPGASLDAVDAAAPDVAAPSEDIELQASQKSDEAFR